MNIGSMDLTSASLQAARATLERPVDATAIANSADSKDAAARMEKLFATMLVKELRRSLPSGMFGEGAGSDIFEGWFDQNIGDSLADSGALDLAGQIKHSIDQKHAAAERAYAEFASREEQRPESAGSSKQETTERNQAPIQS